MLKERPATIPFDPGELAIPIEPHAEQLPPPPSGLQKLLPGAKAKHAQAVTEAEARYAEELAQAVQAERARQTTLAAAEALQEHRRGERSSRPVRDDVKRRSQQGHSRHDKRIRQSFVRVRAEQATRAAERQQPALPVGGTRGNHSQDRAA
jgi:hypothetical protein